MRSTPYLASNNQVYLSYLFGYLKMPIIKGLEVFSCHDICVASEKYYCKEKGEIVLMFLLFQQFQHQQYFQLLDL